MSSLNEIYIKRETLATMLKTCEQANYKGVAITVNINDNDRLDKYGNNISCWVKQTKEQQEARAERFYVANGKCVWTNGKIEAAPKQQQGQQSAPQPTTQKAPFDDLPF